MSEDKTEQSRSRLVIPDDEGPSLADLLELQRNPDYLGRGFPSNDSFLAQSRLASKPSVEKLVSSCPFPVWRKIQLGVAPTVDWVMSYLRARGVMMANSQTREILSRVVLAPIPTEIELVLVTPAQLGFSENVSLRAIYERAFELDLYLCPTEVGLELRRQHMDQKRGGCLIIAMEPFEDLHKELHVLAVEYDSRYGRRFNTCSTDDLDKPKWSPSDVWVFTRPETFLFDCSVRPFIESGHEVRPEDQIATAYQGLLDPRRIALYLDKAQKSGHKQIRGRKLKDKLDGQLVLPVSVLNFLLEWENRRFIPRIWRGMSVSFWGTILRWPGGNPYVRSLSWFSDHWNPSYHELDSGFNENCYAAIAAS